MIKLCIFDLDGTLANTLEDLADATNYALCKNGLVSHPVENYKHYVGNGVIKLIMRAANTNDENLISKIKSDFDDFYAKNSLVKTSAYAGCSDMLKTLKNMGIMCAVLSNKPDEFVGEILKYLYPDFTFDCFFGKRKEFEPKPNPASVLSLIDSLNVKTEECIYIGDSNVDIFTAKNAGLKSCGVLWGFRDYNELSAAGADFIAASPIEIINCVRKINA